MVFLRRSSNSPRYFAPASMPGRSSETTRLPRRISGMFPSIIFCASPSTMDDLPTPGSPISTGLFFVRRDRICTMRSISFARPITGSSSPFFAARVRSRAYASSIGVSDSSAFPFPSLGAFSGLRERPSARRSSSRALFRSTPIFTSACAATPARSRISASRICSVSIASLPRSRASRALISKTVLERIV